MLFLEAASHRSRQNSCTDLALFLELTVCTARHHHQSQQSDTQAVLRSPFISSQNELLSNNLFSQAPGHIADRQNLLIQHMVQAALCDLL